MTDVVQRGVLYVIACATRVAGRIDALIIAAQQAGWDVCVIVTPKALNFIDKPRLEDLTSRPVRHDYKLPEEPDLFPPADAVILFPASFNTINKLAAGISDTLALGVLNEYVGRRKPVVAIPCLSTGNGLDSHPAFIRSLGLLQEYGVHAIYEPEQYPPRNEVPVEIIMETLERLYHKE
jgi:hypothetical protein